MSGDTVRVNSGSRRVANDELKLERADGNALGGDV